MRLQYLLALIVCVSPLLAQTDSALKQDPSGWVEMLPPPDFEGWKRISIPPTDPLSELMQWSVDPVAKTLTCSGKGGHEWLRNEEQLSNYILHAEWRFAPLPDKPRYNSGVGIRLSRLGEIWHQAQTGEAGAYLFGVTLVDGGLAFQNLKKEMSLNRVRPAGEWNTFEIHVKDDSIALWVNGAVVNNWTGSGIRKGFIGFEAEGYEITFRNIKLKKLP